MSNFTDKTGGIFGVKKRAALEAEKQKAVETAAKQARAGAVREKVKGTSSKPGVKKIARPVRKSIPRAR